MQKKLWQSLTAGVLLGLCALTGDMAVAMAEQVPVKVINHSGRADLPAYIQLETTEVPGYNLYTNGRFGFSAYIPAEMNSCFLPANGDGASFYNEAGVGLVVSGMHNVLGHTTREEYEQALRQHPSASYRDCGEGWYVRSYLNELKGLIIYEKHFVNRDYLNTLYIAYPQEERDYYGALLEVLEENFVPSRPK